MKRIEGRVAVVTGAGSGIGQATAELLGRRGARVAVADVSVERAEATAASLVASGVDAEAFAVDVGDRDSVYALAAAVEARMGPAEILVNNAGVTSAGRFEAESDEDLRWLVDINLWGVVHGCRAFLPQLHRGDEAHIVNISSMVGLLGFGFNTSYALTKGAVRSFTEALRSELIATPIGVSVVFPGSINTNIIHTARGSEAARLAGMGASRWAPRLLRPPSAVANKVVRVIEHDRARALVGPDAILVDVISRTVPSRSGLLGRAMSRMVAP